MRNLKFFAAAAVFAGIVLSLGLLQPAKPASATIHEIVASFCASPDSNGKQLEPPGQSGQGSEQAFVRAMQATGVLTITPYADGILAHFDDSRPAAKISAVQVDPYLVFPGVYFDQLITLDHQAFDHCKNLNP